ncbi:MAG: DUF4340 domain-containing protein [Ruminococcus sp.]|jgi:hypothetical protein|nr:DUF4340 domain-containing protein [Ruminococcus sp.]
MSKRVKSIVIAAAVLVVVAVGAFLTLKFLPQGKSDEPEIVDETPASRLLYDLDPLSLESVNIKNSHGEYNFHKFNVEGTHFFLIPEFLMQPISDANYDALMDAASSLVVQTTVTEDAADLSVYGLSEPRAEVISVFDGDRAATKDLLIGNDTPDGGETYVSFRGEKTVYTVKTDDINIFLEGKYYYLSKVVYTQKTAVDENDTTDYSKIDKLTVTRQDLPYDFTIEYDKRADDPEMTTGNMSRYRLTDPVLINLDPTKSQSFTQGIFGLTATDIAKDLPLQEDLVTYGLDEPYGRMEATIAGETFAMDFGAESFDDEGNKTGRYCKVDGIDIVYIFSEESLPWLTVMPLDITTNVITSNYIYNLTSFEIMSDEFDYQFKLTGTGLNDFAVTLNGNEIGAQDFRDFYQFFLKAPAEQIFLEETTGTPVVTAVMTGEDINDTIEFIPDENRRTIVRINGVPAFSLRTSYVDRLIQNTNAIVSGEDIISSW